MRARVPGGGRGREAGRFKGRDARACFCLTIRLSHSPLISSLSLSPLFPGRARPRGQVARMLRVNAELVVALNQRAVKGLTRASRLRQVGGGGGGASRRGTGAAGWGRTPGFWGEGTGGRGFVCARLPMCGRPDRGR